MVASSDHTYTFPNHRQEVSTISCCSPYFEEKDEAEEEVLIVSYIALTCAAVFQNLSFVDLIWSPAAITTFETRLNIIQFSARIEYLDPDTREKRCESLKSVVINWSFDDPISSLEIVLN